MRHHQKVGVAIILVIGVALFASSFFKLDAQSDNAKSDKATIIKRNRPATDEEKEYSKEYKKRYPDTDAKRLLEMAKSRRTNEIVGSSIGEPSRPTVGGLTATSNSDLLSRATCEADLIAVGKIEEKVAHLTDDGRFIYTQYELTVVDIIKNISEQSVSIGREVRLTRPGGLISLDNQLIKIEDKSYPDLSVGDYYLLFLRYVPGAKGFIASTVDGTFEVRNGAVEQLPNRSLAQLTQKGSDDVFDSIRGIFGGCKGREEVRNVY